MKSFVISFALIFISCLGYAQTRQYLLAGQSNARGRGDAALSPTVDPLVSFEYHPTLDSLIQLQDPVGVNSGGFQQAATGSAWPALAQTYFDLTGDTTALIPAARGGSGVHPISASAGANWSTNGLLYSLCQFKIDQAMMLTGLPLDGIIWVQGEQDAARINFGAYEQDDYRDALIDMINRFRSDYGCAVPFYMVLLGANTEDAVEGYDAVRAAQAEVAAIHPHTYLIHQNAVNFPGLGWMLDNVHYSQEGYNEIGTVGAASIVTIEDTYYTCTQSTTDTICPGDSVLLSAPPMYTNYQWSNGDSGQNIFVTAGGEYSVMVTDSSGCTFPLRPLKVEAYPDQIRPMISLSANDTLCAGDMLTLTASPAGQNYIWSNGATSSSITTNTEGDFFVQTIDTNGCLSEPSDTISTAVISFSQPSITMSGTSSTICEGDSVILSLPAGFEHYLWSNGEITQSITVTTSGSFNGTVGFAQCISEPSEFTTISVNTLPPTPLISANDSVIFCEGDSVTLSASAELNRYLWSTGDTTQSITVYNSGIYSCAFIGDNDCIGQEASPITVIANPLPATPTVSVIGNTELCQGDELTLNAPTGFSAYQWSTGATTSSITVNSAGTFDVTVTDTNDCQSLPSNPITTTVNPLPPAPTITADGPTTFCEGDSVTLSAPSGFANYLWSNGEITQSIIVTDSGTFDVIVTDTNGCESPASEAMVITETTAPAPPVISIIGSLTFCEGDSVTLIAPAGFANYQWSNNANTQSITIHNSGIFDVTVTDNNNCESPASESLIVTSISTTNAPMIAVSGPTTFCEGESVILTAPAGSSYQWSNNEISQSIIVTASGTYTCVVTSADDCESPPSIPVIVTVDPLPATPTITPDNSTTLCQGESVTLTAPPGFSDYLWSNGEITQSIIVTASGTFDVTVIDANGCTSSASPQIVVDVNSVTTPSVTTNGPITFCDGESVTLTAPAGFSDYLWSNGEITQSITVTTSGTFDVVVTDANDCQSMPSASITTTAISASTAPVITVSGDTNICQGESVTLTAPPGFSNYSWSTGAITQSITVSTTGIYSCTITGASNCESPPSAPVNVTVNPIPDAPTITPDNSTTFCQGESVTLNATGGFSDYLWSNGEITQNITVTTSGTFDVIVNDANGCTSSASSPITVNVNSVATPSITASGSTTFCDGESVILSAPSGFTNYLWSNGEITQSITVTTSGTFDVIVTGANDCQSPNSMPVTVVALSATTAPVLTASGSTTLCDGESVTISAPAGLSGYSWSNGDTTQSIVVTNSDTFVCEITNANGCPSPPSAPITVTVNPLPATPTITANGAITFCEGNNVVLSAPSGFQNYQWSNGEITQNITVTDAGDYDVRVIDANGCMSPNSQETTVTVNALPVASPIMVSGATTFCEGDNVTLSAPSGFTDYQWSTGEITQSITVYNTGTFEYFVTDENDCVSANSESVQITVNELPTAPAITVSGATTFCEGESVMLSAPMGFVGYEWSTGETTQSITVYESGTYDCFVTNGNNCASANSNPIDITVNPAPQTPTVTASGATTFCEGGSVILSAPSGFQNYEWSNGEITPSITVFESGDYDVFVTNNNGCASPNSQEINITVNELPDAPAIMANGATTFCEGDNVILSAPSGFQSYEWSNGEITPSITVFESGTFEYFLTDANGCMSANSESLEIIVHELPPVPEIVAEGATTFCEGESVTISAPDGFSNYLWSNGEMTRDITVFTEGSYDVTITNANGCSSASAASEKIIVNPLPSEPIVQAVGTPLFCQGDSVTLMVSGSFNNYLWSTGEITQDITVSETGTFSCTVTDVNGCQNFSAPFNTIENEALPIPEITFSGEIEFCEGDSVTLFAPTGYNYLWSNGDTTQNITIDETSGPLSCIIMDDDGCMSESSDTTFVKVFPIPPVPTIDTSGFTTLCFGTTVELIATAGFDAYLWSNGESTQSINVGVSGNYSVTVFNDDGCGRESLQSVDVTVIATPEQPTVSINGSTSFCDGGSVILSAPAGAAAYLWSNGETTQSITVAETGEFYCVVFDEFGCQSQQSVTVSTTVFGLPDVPVISLSEDAILCPGDTVILSAEPGFATYFWSNGAVSEQIIATSDSEYSYFVVDENDCQSGSSDTVSIEVRPLPPVVSIHSSNDFNFCNGDSITLEADEGFLSYLWSTGDTARAIIVNNADDFFYTADDGFSCEDAISPTVTTGINPPPPASAITQTNIDTLCASEVADSYLWYRNDTLTGFTTRCIAPELNGDWQVVGIVDNCLSEFSTAYEYTGRPPLNPDAPPSMTVFPSPAVNGTITIQTTNIPEDVVVLDIYDVLGRLLYRYRLEVQKLPRYEFVVDIERLPDAVYVAVIDAGFSGRFVQKFVVDD